MQVKTKLRTAANTVLDSNGNGQVMMSPDSASVRWQVTRIAVRTNQSPTQPPFPQAELFDSQNPVASDSYGATASGNNDVFDISGYPIDIDSQDAILIVWSGGIPGSAASATVRGYKFLEYALWGGVTRFSVVLS